MSQIRWYLNATTVDGWQLLDQSAAAAATLVNGWVVGTGLTNSSEFASGAAGDRASTTFVANTVPDGTLDTTLKDAFRSQNPSTGDFAAGNWTFQFAVVSTVQSGAADGQIVFRIIKADADGSNATQITTAQQATTIATNVAGTDINITATWAAPAWTITNQYIFVQVAWKRTGAGGMTTTNIRLRTGSSTTVGTTGLTADFVAQVTGATIASTVVVRDAHTVVFPPQAVSGQTIPATGRAFYTETLLFETVGASTGGFGFSSGARNLCQTITGHSGILTSVSLLMKYQTVAPVSAVYLEIRESTLNGTLLGTSLRKIAEITSTESWVNFPLDGIVLSAGTTYWLEVYTVAPGNGVTQLVVGCSTDNSYTGGELSNGSGSTTGLTDYDALFRLYTGTSHTLTPNVTGAHLASTATLPTAVVLASQAGSDGSTGIAAAGARGPAQVISGHTATLSAVLLDLSRTGLPAGSAYVQIRSGSWTGTIVGTSESVACSSAVEAPAIAVVSFPFASGVALTGGTYYVECRRDAPVDDGGSIAFSWWFSASGAYAGGDMVDSGGNPIVAGWDFGFSLIAGVSHTVIADGAVGGVTIPSASTASFEVLLLENLSTAATSECEQPGRNYCQTISGHTGWLTAVSLYMHGNGFLDDAVYLEIREGSLNGTLLATSAHVHASSAPMLVSAWVKFSLTTGVALHAGTTYWIETYLTRTVAGNPANDYHLRASTGDQYAGGEEKDSAGAQVAAGQDLSFRLHVTNGHAVAVTIEGATLGVGSAVTAPTVVAPAGGLLTSLVSFWELEETSGTRADAHGTNHLTDNATVTSGTGKVGTAADFEKDNGEYLSIATNTSIEVSDIDFTFAAWVKFETVPSFDYGTVLSKIGAQYGYILDYNGYGDDWRFNVSPDGSAAVQVATFVPATVGTWYFIVAWHDATANTINIQVNNGTPASTAHSTGVYNTSAAFEIGRSGGYLRYMDGLLDQVGFWKRVLTSGERTDLYNSGAGLSYAEISGGAPPDRAVTTAFLASTLTVVVPSVSGGAGGADQAVTGVTLASTLALFTPTVSVPPSGGGLLEDLVAYWPLNETSGTRADAHGPHDLTPAAAVATATGHVYSLAGDFESGSNNYMTAADHDDLSASGGDFTVAAWVNLESSGFTGQIIGKGDSGGYEWALEYAGGSFDRFRFRTASATGEASAAQVLQGGGFGAGNAPGTGTWRLVIGWHDATANVIGIAGSQDGTTFAGHTEAYSANIWNSTGLLNVGRGGPYFPSYFDGLIGPVMLWTRVLTQTERQDLWNSGSGLTYEELAPEPPAAQTILAATISGAEELLLEDGGGVLLEDGNDLLLEAYVGVAVAFAPTVDQLIAVTTTPIASGALVQVPSIAPGAVTINGAFIGGGYATIAYGNTSTSDTAYSGGTSLTWAHTVAAGTNRGLFVGCSGDATLDDVIAVTYGGVALTQIAKVTDPDAPQNLYFYWLADPAVGTANIVATFTNSHFIETVAVTYTGVSGVPEATTTNDAGVTGTNNFTTSVTTLTPQAWTLYLVNMAYSGVPIVPGTGSTLRIQGALWAITALFDSNAAHAIPGSKSMQVTAPALSSFGGILASVAPAVAGGGATLSAPTVTVGAVMVSGAETLVVTESAKAAVTPRVTRPVETVTVLDVVTPLVKTVRLTVAVAETLTVTEVRKAVTTPRVARPVETLGVTDAVTPLVKTVRIKATVADAIAVTESRKAVATPLVVRPVELVAVLDVVTPQVKTVRLTVGAAEVVAVADVVMVGAAALLASRADPVSVLDVVTPQAKTVRITAALAETAAVAETVKAVTTPRAARPVETLTVLDVVTPQVKTVRLKVGAAETLVVTETAKAVATPRAARPVDLVGVLDVAQPLLTLARLKVTAAEPLTVTEVRKAVTTPQVLRPVETLGVTDAVTPLVKLARLKVTLADPGTVTDVVTPLRRLVRLTVGVADAVTVAESATRVVPQLAVHASEQVLTEDAANAGGALLSIRPSDTITVTDSAKAVATPRAVRVGEAVVVTDNAKAIIPALTVRVAEAVAVTEVRKAALPQLAVHAAEALTVTEVRKGVLRQLAVHAAETLTVTEIRKAVAKPWAVRVADAITVAESAKAVRPLLVARVADILTVTEIRKAVIPALAVRVAETLTVTETRKAVLPLTVRVAETLAATDVVVAGAAVLQIPVADYLGVFDPVQPQLRTVRLRAVVTDSITTTDASAVALRQARLKVTVADSVSVTDAGTPLLKLARPKVAVADSVSVADAVTTAVTPLVLWVADTITVTDSVRSGAAALNVAVADSVSVTDARKAVLPLLVARVADAALAADAARAVVPALAARVADAVAVVDAARAVEPQLAVHAAEAIGVADAPGSSVPVLAARPVDLLHVTDAVTALVALPRTRYAYVADETMVTEAVAVALTTVTHFVGGELKGAGSRPQYVGTLVAPDYEGVLVGLYRGRLQRVEG